MMFRLLLASLLCSLTLSVNAQPRSEFSVIRGYVSPIVVKKKAPGKDSPALRDDGSGSLIVISPTLAISALHVIENEDDFGELKKEFFVMRHGKSIRAQVVKKSNEADIVLLRGNFQCPCVEIGKVDPVLDEEVFAVGYPLYSFYKVQFLTRGSIQGMFESSGLLVSTASTAPGGSGGGLFNKQDGKYKLVGVVVAIGSLPVGTGILKSEQYQTWITFSVPLSSINNLLSGIKY